MPIIQIYENSRTLFSVTTSTIGSYIKNSILGNTINATVPIILPWSFSANLAPCFIGILQRTNVSASLTLSLKIYNNQFSTYTIGLGIGYIQELFSFYNLYRQKDLSGQYWTFDFTDPLSQKYTVTLDHNMLVSLFTNIDMAENGGTPSDIEGLAQVAYIPITNQDTSNSEGNSSPLSPYDD